jgi:hypothetical protein
MKTIIAIIVLTSIFLVGCTYPFSLKKDLEREKPILQEVSFSWGSQDFSLELSKEPTSTQKSRN